MKLSVLDRILLLGLIPAEGNYITYKILANLRQELSFSEKELKEFELKGDVNTETQKINYTWSDEKAKEKHFEIGAQALEIIRTALKKLDADGKINVQNSILYEKFMTTIIPQENAKQ